MSFIGNLPSSGGGGADPSLPLNNLSAVQARIDSVRQFLSASLSTDTLIQKADMDAISSEISSAIHQIMVNGAALLACSQSPKSKLSKAVDLKLEIMDEETSDGYEILELDAVELLAEHVHFCEICGKGFKRDANLRMHMRAHGNQFKTPEALAKPPESVSAGAAAGRKTRFSCPYVGCNRNKQHKKFRPLKSAICVKNHFKRSHCPKMYSCDRCNKKFSVMADLKCHLKHCGETNKWKCSCGTTFSRKDKLFGHVALFEGHMPAVLEEEKPMLALVKVDEEESLIPVNEMDVDDGFLDGFNFPADYCFQDLLCSPADSGVDVFFNL